jgi:malonyl-CoA/methylmalonyl-CoA synthetase
MLLDLFDGALADRPDAPALCDLTLRQFHDGARRIARRFAEMGVREGERVAMYCENRLGFALAYVASLRLGAVAVPINPLYRSIEVSHVLGDCAPALVVYSRDGARWLNESTGVKPPAVDADEIEEWASDARIAPLHCKRPLPEDVALVIYTSGTTGRAKGAMLSHRNLAAIAAQLIAAWRWHPDDTLLLTLPLFHVHGLVAGLSTSLCAGSRVVLHERFDAASVVERLARGDVSMFFGVPTMYVRLLECAQAKIGHLRLFVCGSAALPERVHREFARRFGVAVLERYGATEFGFALGNRYGGPRVAGSVGVPLPGVRVRIAAEGATRALPPGEIGELLVAGPNVFCGYWQQPEATAAVFAMDCEGTRWYRSGDLAQYDAESDTYRIVGRIKDVIISGGFNVYPAEVEAAIETFPSVRACAVVGMADSVRGERPVAFVEADASLDVEALRDELRVRLASFKIPVKMHVVGKLPRNAMGKVDKPALRDRL